MIQKFFFLVSTMVIIASAKVPRLPSRLCKKNELCAYTDECGADGFFTFENNCSIPFDEKQECKLPMKCCKNPCFRKSVDEAPKAVIELTMMTNCSKNQACVKYDSCSGSDTINSEEALRTAIPGGSCDIYKGLCCTIPDKIDTDGMVENCTDEESCEGCDKDGVLKNAVEKKDIVVDPPGIICNMDEDCVEEGQCLPNGTINTAIVVESRSSTVGIPCNNPGKKCCLKPVEFEEEYDYGDSTAEPNQDNVTCSKDEACLPEEDCDDSGFSTVIDIGFARGGDCDTAAEKCCKFKNKTAPTNQIEIADGQCAQDEACIDEYLCIGGIAYFIDEPSEDQIGVKCGEIAGKICCKLPPADIIVTSTSEPTITTTAITTTASIATTASITTIAPTGPTIPTVAIPETTEELSFFESSPCNKREACVEFAECNADGFIKDGVFNDTAKPKLGVMCDVLFNICCKIRPSTCQPDYDCVTPSLCKGGKINTDGAGVLSRRKRSIKRSCTLDDSSPGTCCLKPMKNQCGTRFREKTTTRAGNIYNENKSKTYLGEFPWHAIIINKSNRIVGNAAIISDKLLLTVPGKVAAYNNSTRKIKVRVGGNDLLKHNALIPPQDIEVKNIYIHKGYKKKTHVNGIALLELTKPITMNDYTQPICLPEEHYRMHKPVKNINDLSYTHECYATGFGVDPASGKKSLILKKARLPLLRHNYCQKLLRKHQKYAKLRIQFLCAGGQGEDTCKGDGGGPLACFNPKSSRFELVGLTSWGIGGCAIHGVPGGYINVYYFLKWIRDTRSKIGMDGL